MIRDYNTLQKIRYFEDRFEYLKLNGKVGESTFGFERYLNQIVYRSVRWRRLRDEIIIRDNGCDLGVEGYEIYDTIYVHHMNPLTMKEIEEDDNVIYDSNFLICVSFNTHNALHYGDESLLVKEPIERKRNDTCPWL